MQKNVIDVVPGDKGYTPLWGVRMATWSHWMTCVLRSGAAIRAAEEAGEVTIERTTAVVNCPVI